MDFEGGIFSASTGSHGNSRSVWWVTGSGGRLQKEFLGPCVAGQLGLLEFEFHLGFVLAQLETDAGIDDLVDGQQGSWGGGRGFGGGGGRGGGRRYPPAYGGYGPWPGYGPYGAPCPPPVAPFGGYGPYAPPPPPEQELEMLRDQAQYLEQVLGDVRQRIEELEAEGEKQ